MRAGGIEVSAGRGEIGRLAFTNGMNVERVLTKGHVSDGKTDQEASLRLGERRYADIFALRVLERRFGSGRILGGSALQQCGPMQNNRAQHRYAIDEFHDLISSKPPQDVSSEPYDLTRGRITYRFR
jgi:hypothetical protein